MLQLLLLLLPLLLQQLLLHLQLCKAASGARTLCSPTIDICCCTSVLTGATGCCSWTGRSAAAAASSSKTSMSASGRTWTLPITVCLVRSSSCWWYLCDLLQLH
jgi:hypothetical protein